MTERFQTDHRELDDLFERYRSAPGSHVFAPLADACRKAGMLDEALEICARGVGHHPRYASGYVVQGKCLYDAGRTRDAQAAFDRVLELDPKNLVALKFLGVIHAERGETARAREYFVHILALDPGDREIRSRMEDVTSVTRERPAPPKPTRAPNSQAPAVDESEASGADDEALVLPELEDETFQGAPITLRDESVTPDEIATMTLADIYASQGYTTRALRIYREVLKRQPGNAALAEKIRALEASEADASKARTHPAAEPAVPGEAARPSPSPEKSVLPRSPAPAPTPAPAGHPIDQSRSYEQFKRWLKASSR
jgi:tetratricopeptide (TPR) repeat protein